MGGLSAGGATQHGIKGRSWSESNEELTNKLLEMDGRETINIKIKISVFFFLNNFFICLLNEYEKN